MMDCVTYYDSFQATIFILITCFIISTIYSSRTYFLLFSYNINIGLYYIYIIKQKHVRGNAGVILRWKLPN